MNLSPEDNIPRSRLLRFYFCEMNSMGSELSKFCWIMRMFFRGLFWTFEVIRRFSYPEIFWHSRNFENLFLRHIPKFYLFTDGIQKRLGCRENGLNICMKLKSIDQKFSEELKIFTLPMEFMSAVTEIGSHKGWSSNKMILTFDHVSSAAPKSRISHG